MSVSECPTCGKEGFASERGRKIHHTHAHKACLVDWGECDYCSSPITMRSKCHDNSYCDNQCLYNSMSVEKVTVPCFYCGYHQKMYPYRAKEVGWRLRQCIQCMERKVEVDCAWCGDDTTAYNYQEEGEWGFFCDRGCAGEYRSENIVGENHPRYTETGKVEDFGKNWDETRENIIQRDGERCVYCGLSRESSYEEYGMDLAVHHRIPRSYYKKSSVLVVEDSNTNRNLVTLCVSDHNKAESGKIEV